MLLADKISSVGVGQCGCNFVVELEKMQFNPFYVNTSLEDLDLIDTNPDYKYHIKGTKGMAKDRILATEYITKDDGIEAENICYAINDQFSMTNIINFYYSLSGGTGGTIGNYIVQKMSELFPNKIINVIAIIPSNNEDIGSQANAIESLQHLKQLLNDGTITQVHLLDNNTREDKFSINKDFAISFGKFVTFDEITTKGNLDAEEKERLLTVPGLAVILDFFDQDFANGLEYASDNTFYAEWLKDPRLHGLILNNKHDISVNKELLKEVVGMATYTHESSWDEESDLIISAGMSFNENILIKLKQNAKVLMERKKKLEEDNKQEILTDVEFDAMSIIQNTNKRKAPSTNTQSSNTSNRRHRARRASSIIDQYKNIGK